MDMQLEGKRAFISGSTTGIGYAIAEALAQEQACVIINGRTKQRVQQAVEALRKRGGDVHGVTADLGTPRGIEQLLSCFPDLDILINNLGIFEPKPFEQISDEDWLRFFEVNVLSGVRLSRHYLPRMKERGWGRVIFISSESGLQIPSEMIHYGTTKTAQLAVARGLAETLAGTNVTVNSVLPGPTASEGALEFMDRLAASNQKSREQFEKEFFDNVRPSSILKRFERPEEIGSVVAFLCSPLASAITGAAIRADGGVVRSIG
ncbi:MAG: SDR family oxidoreductase [Acidobacteriaceae bacterium]|nr:SDR family oxidoreductase [Acidobacteriaceae bacterium]